jgi:hypothetical protein
MTKVKPPQHNPTRGDVEDNVIIVINLNWIVFAPIAATTLE